MNQATDQATEKPILLLVDDEPNILRALRRVFRGEPYEIVCAENAEEALAWMELRPASVIIADQRMPGMTGIEFLQRVRERWPDTMRIVLSGFTDAGTVADAINKGEVYRFLTKPWDDQELRTAVKLALDHQRLAVENTQLWEKIAAQNEELQLLNRLLRFRVEEGEHDILVRGEALKVAQEILEHLPVPVVGFDTAGLIIYANRMAREVFNGAREGGFLGRSVVHAFPQEVAGALEQLETRSGPQLVDVEMDGVRISLECHRFEVDGEVRGSIVMGRTACGVGSGRA